MPHTYTLPPALLCALSLPDDPSKVSYTSNGYGGFAESGHLHCHGGSRTSSSPNTHDFFIKFCGSNLREAPASAAAGGRQVIDFAREQCRGEFVSLNAIATIVPELCPRGVAWGAATGDGSQEEQGEIERVRKIPERADRWFLATEYLKLAGWARGRDGQSLARQLGRLHSTPAPPAPRRGVTNGPDVLLGLGPDEVVNHAEEPVGNGDDEGRQFGFLVPTYCGDTRQPNEFRKSWATFFGEQRLLTVLAESEFRNGRDARLRQLVEQVVSEVVPRLLGDQHLGYDKLGRGKGIMPVIVHGDLWSGNASWGRILRGDASSEEGSIIYDPSAAYGHNEFDIGIMQMFGGFGSDFFREYHRIVPKTEPVEEYGDRVNMYEM